MSSVFFFVNVFIYFLFSSIWLRLVLVRHTVSLILVEVCRIFDCGMWDPAPRPGIEPQPPALEAWSLSHWTIKDVLGHSFIRY